MTTTPLSMKTIAQIAAELQGYDPQALKASDVNTFLDQLVEPVAQTEKVGLFEALGRVLAQGVVSPISVPPHDNSAMDGYAFAGGQLVAGQPLTLRVVGTALSPEFIFAGLFGMPDMRGYGIFWVDQDALAAAYDLRGSFNRVSVKLAPGALEPEGPHRVTERPDGRRDRVHVLGQVEQVGRVQAEGGGDGRAVATVGRAASSRRAASRRPCTRVSAARNPRAASSRGTQRGRAGPLRGSNRRKTLI